MNEHTATRTWLVTWTTYGTWLPGDERGFVGKVREPDGTPRLRNEYGTPWEAPNPKLARYAREIMKGDPIYLNYEQAQAVGAQFHETARHRQWTLLAAAVMCNHAHLVVEVPASTDPEVLLRDFKSYASRALNRHRRHALGHSWWTESGSKRPKDDPDAIAAAIRYVERQPNALYVWSINLERKRIAQEDRERPA